MSRKKKSRLKKKIGMRTKETLNKGDGNDDAASLDEDNVSDGESILDEVIRNNEESYHH